MVHSRAALHLMLPLWEVQGSACAGGRRPWMQRQAGRPGRTGLQQWTGRVQRAPAQRHCGPRCVAQHLHWPCMARRAVLSITVSDEVCRPGGSAWLCAGNRGHAPAAEGGGDVGGADAVGRRERPDGDPVRLAGALCRGGGGAAAGPTDGLTQVWNTLLRQPQSSVYISMQI